MQPSALPVRTKLAYGAGDLGFSVTYTIISLLFLYFLTDVAGLTPALAGAAVLVGKLWDGVVDPYLGHLSDRTASRWGRRRVFMLAGFLPYGLTFMLLWWTPPQASQALLFAWAAAAYLIHTTATSAVGVPYSCLMAELTTDYDERTSLTAYRMAFSILGGLVAAAVPLEVVQAFGGGRAGFMAMAIAFGALAALSPLFPLIGTREQGAPQADQFPLWQAMRTTLSNRAFRVALAVYLLTWTAMDVIAAMLVYFLKYGLGLEAQTAPILGLMFLVATLCLPLWVRISRRWNKKVAYVAGLSLLAGVLTATAFLRPGMQTWAWVLAGLAGVGVAAAHVVPWSLIPDVVEDDELRTGRRREGDFFGLISFAQTLAASAAIFLSGLALELAGYVPDQAQGPQALAVIRLLLGPVPAVAFVTAMGLLAFYPIDRTEHARIVAELARRREEGAHG